jgi:hypothetical protein
MQNDPIIPRSRSLNHSVLRMIVGVIRNWSLSGGGGIQLEAENQRESQAGHNWRSFSLALLSGPIVTAFMT